MPAIPRQRRYDQVMGDREPKVTDKRFVQELQQRLDDKYLTVQQQKERRLAEAESRRIRKLVLDGVIESAGEARDNSRGARRRSDDDWKEFWPPNPHKTLAEYEEDKRRKADENGRQQQQQETQRSADSAADGEVSAAPSSGPAGGGADQHSTQPASLEQHAAGRYDGSQSPRIDELMQEEDLDQLYSKASGIVYIMAPPVRKQPVKPLH